LYVTPDIRVGRCHLLEVHGFFQKSVRHLKILGAGEMMCSKFLKIDPTNTRPHGVKFSRPGDLISILSHPRHWSLARVALIFGWREHIFAWVVIQWGMLEQT